MNVNQWAYTSSWIAYMGDDDDDVCCPGKRWDRNKGPIPEPRTRQQRCIASRSSIPGLRGRIPTPSNYHPDKPFKAPHNRYMNQQTKHDGAKMHVDHIKPRSKYPRLELDFDNLQVLCEDCNLGKSNRYKVDLRPAKKKASVYPLFSRLT